MPKQKLDPQFPKAAKLQGEAKAVYLARGELDPAANQLVLTVKHAHLAMVRVAKKAPIVPGTEIDAPERAAALTDARRGLVAKHNENLEICGEVMRCAILNNDAVFFRQIADVIDQHKANGETVANDRIQSRPTSQLASDISRWALANDDRHRTFSELWAWLEGLAHWPFGRLRTAEKVKSAQVSVRRTAAAIGIVFAPDSRGPK